MIIIMKWAIPTTVAIDFLGDTVNRRMIGELTFRDWVSVVCVPAVRFKNSKGGLSN